MKTINSLLGLVIVVGWLGCTTSPENNRPSAGMELPASTPFDANPMARMVYLDAYADGYRTFQQGGDITTDRLRGQYRVAKEMGWRAGVGEAQRAAGAATSAGK